MKWNNGGDHKTTLATKSMTLSNYEGTPKSSLSAATPVSSPQRTTTFVQGEGKGVHSAHNQAASPALPAEERQLRVQPAERGRRRHQLPALLPEKDEHPQGAHKLHLQWQAYGSEHWTEPSGLESNSRGDLTHWKANSDHPHLSNQH